MQDFPDGRRGFAVRWFALAAVVLCAVSMAGARTLDWLSQSGRIALVAYGPRPAAAEPRSADAGVDMTPTGSIPPSRSLVIRLR